MNQFEKAVSYAKKGIAIFPCSIQKKPLIKNGNGYKDATHDLRTVKSWWKKYPDALIGSPNDQFTVLDIDNYGLCEAGKALNDKALNRLKSEGIISNQTLVVTTISGGTHIYFKKHDMIKRSIGCLPSIDLLGHGGYVILPDQTNYHANSLTPWDDIDSLTEFPFERFSYLQEDMYDETKEAKKLKNRNKAHKKPTKKFHNPTEMQTDIEGYLHSVELLKSSNKTAGMADYENGKIHFDEKDNVYQQTTETFVKADPEEKILKDGKLVLSEGELDTNYINRLFHNQEIQMLMATKLGLKTTHTGERKLMNSILPEHNDFNASLGIRWSGDKSHIIIRDFANFYSSKYEQYDYNLIRLYASIMYKTNAPRLSPAEFVVWFCRLLYETGIISLDNVIGSYNKDITKLKETDRKVAESILVLDAIKRLYGGYDGTTTFADKFSAAWSGLSVKSIGVIKRRLADKGFIEYVGVYDCSGGKRDDGFFKTPLYKIVTEKKMHIQDVIVNKEVRELKEQARARFNGDVSGKKTKQEKSVESTYPDMGTVYALGISDESYEKITNFCADAGLTKTQVLQKNMFSPILISHDFIEEVIEDKTQTIFADRFRLITDKTEDGYTILIAVGESPAYDDIWNKIESDHSEHRHDSFDEPVPHFVISWDVDDKTIKNLDNLTMMFNRYLEGKVSFQGMKTIYLSKDQIEDIIDGRQPEE